MSQKYLKIVSLLFGLAAAGALGGCASPSRVPTITSGNPAAPPAPPAELPSALRFPESIAIDISTIDATGSGALSAFSVGDPFGPEIDFVATSARFPAILVDREVLAPLQSITIPIGPDVTTFEDVIFIGDVLKNIKIDFSPFAYDAEGRGLDCSGNTAALPICYRVWIGNVRTLAGIFETYPTDENAGIGRFKGLPLSDTIEGFIGAIYDLSDPADESTEVFSAGGGLDELSRVLLTQEGTAEALIKTVNLSFQEGGKKTRDVGRFQDQGDFLSLSQETDHPERESFTAVCADLNTKKVTEQSECVDAGVDVTDIPFIDFAAPEDVLLPISVPALPPFDKSPFHSL